MVIDLEDVQSAIVPASFELVVPPSNGQELGSTAEQVPIL
jgi:hypothetical protein